MFCIASQTLVGSVVELPGDGEKIFLGHDAVFERCTIRFRTRQKDRIRAAKCRFSSCEIVAEVPLRNVDWSLCHLSNCRFSGQFEQSEFGHWPHHYRAFVGEGYEGSLARCDFGQSRLDGCRFFGCKMSDMVLPRWPCFTVLDPPHTFPRFNAAVEARAEAPDWLKQWISLEVRLWCQPASADSYRDLVAATNYFPQYSKWMLRRLEVPESGLRDFLSRFKEVIL